MYYNIFKLSEGNKFLLVLSDKMVNLQDSLEFIKEVFNPDKNIEIYSIFEVFTLDVVHVSYFNEPGSSGFLYTFIFTVRHNLCLDPGNWTIYAKRLTNYLNSLPEDVCSILGMGEPTFDTASHSFTFHLAMFP